MVIARARFSADLSAFLPRVPSPTQQLLVHQLQNGLAARLILIGIEGGEAAQRAQTARAMTAALSAEPDFLTVNDGEPPASSATAPSSSRTAMPSARP